MEDQSSKIFIITGAEYNYMPVGANYLAQALLAHKETVIYLEQPSFLSLFRNPLYFWRILRKFIYLNLNTNNMNVVSISSKILPIRKEATLKNIGFGFLYQFQEKLLIWEINRIKHMIGKTFKKSSIVVLFNDPFGYRVAEQFKPSLIIFRVCDRYEKYPGWENQEDRMKNIFEKAIKESDIILATSTFIYKEILT